MAWPPCLRGGLPELMDLCINGTQIDHPLPSVPGQWEEAPAAPPAQEAVCPEGCAAALREVRRAKHLLLLLP